MTSAEKKHYLKGYTRARAKISRLQIQYNQLFYAELMPGIQSDGMPHGHDPKGLEEYAAKRDSILRSIAAAKMDCIDIMTEIVWNIDQVRGKDDDETERERNVLMLKYIDDLSWQGVADAMHYSRQHAERIHGSALLHFNPSVMTRYRKL